MEEFLRIFVDIDRDRSENITIREMEDYVKRNGYESSMVDKWKKIFDKHDTGFITLQTFCDTLGIQITDALNLWEEKYDIGSDVKTVMVTMPPRQRQDVINFIREIFSSDNIDYKNRATNRIKQFLDDKYGRVWNVFISDGSTWCSFAHLVNTSFFFEYQRHVFVIWKNIASENI